MSDQLQQALSAFQTRLGEVHDAAALYELQVEFLGKKGSVTRLRGQMGKLAPEERKAFGQAFNATKKSMEEALEARAAELKSAARDANLARYEDLTMPAHEALPGRLHILTQTRRSLERVFQRFGFDVVDGPHVEHEKYNFDDLNIAAGHPARDMADTFFVKGRPGGESAEDLVLRTHTSPVQIRSMLARKPPLRIVALGTVFRRDDDATHTPMFHQIEGLCVDKGVTMADLKSTLYAFCRHFFGADLEVRFRPSYFPFVEPGAEFDLQCPFCSGDGCSVCSRSGWIELGGSGMVHPAVFEAVGYDPEAVTGWAFGFGIDRMAMLLHGVPDLRLLFEGDTRFLEQFPC